MAKKPDAPPKPAAPGMTAKQLNAFSSALKRVAQLNLKTATPEQKQAAALDIVSIFQLIGAAWPLIQKVLEFLKLPIPAQPVPTK